ncbi:MAG: hypothetical protein WCL44_08720 [bacterium]
MRKRCLTVLLAVLVFLSAFAFSATEKPPRILILFSNSSNGILRACYCPNSPWGGLAKRAWLVDQIRAVEGVNNVLLLDAGDLFPVDPDIDGTLALLRAYSLMNYDAVAIGDQELTGGIAAWKNANRLLVSRYPQAESFPWVSAGYVSKADGQSIARPWTIKSIAGYRVGVVSVAGPAAFAFGATNKLAGLDMADPRTVIAQFVKEHGKDLDLVVVLSHQGVEADRKLAESLAGIDIIIGGHSQSIVCPPEMINSVAICQAGKNGENLGILALEPTSAAERDPTLSQAMAIQAAKASPFEWCMTFGRRHRFTSRLVPLDTTVDEQEEVAGVIDDCYGIQDQNMEKRLKEPPIPSNEVPRLLVRNPIQSVVMRAGETARFAVTLQNVGKADLKIEKARSKIRWLSVTNCTAIIAPGGAVDVTMSVTATNIDRYFRSEYSITTSDKERIVVVGTINGRIEGDIPGIIDVGSMMDSMSGAVGATATNGVTQPLAVQPGTVPASNTSRILVEFFYAPGCDECGDMESEVLPELTRRFGTKILLRQYSIVDKDSYLHLAGLQEELKIRTNEKVSIYLNGTIHIGGLKAIRRELFAQVENIIAGQDRTEGATNQPAILEDSPGKAQSENVLTVRMRSFTTLAILVAGLLDGLNPCAFATMIFLVTMLSVGNRDRRTMLVAGMCFCVVVFFTYLLLGLGVFQILLKLRLYKALSSVLSAGMIAVLFVLAVLSFRDAWLFRRTGRADSVLLQLPNGLKKLIHTTIRTRVGLRSVVIGTAAAGFVVTILESVCTGQVYVPTLVYLTTHPELHWRAWMLLVLYNMAFVLPLLVIFVAAYHGVRSDRFAAWSRQNVVWAKILMGFFFLGLMILMTAV